MVMFFLASKAPKGIKKAVKKDTVTLLQGYIFCGYLDNQGLMETFINDLAEPMSNTEGLTERHRVRFEV